LELLVTFYQKILDDRINGTATSMMPRGGGANTDYGNSTQATVGSIGVGMNKAH
jgi:hypothetical protein